MSESVVSRVAPSAPADIDGTDPITTEIARGALQSTAAQMKNTLVRTAFSSVIYDALDFAVAVYDHQYRLLGQALGAPHFMGTLSYCVRAAVERSGGVEELAPGDIILLNVPYDTGSHPQDCAMVMPAYSGGALIGFAAVKAHWLDLGAKDPYSTDTIDVYQEGLKFPGVKLYRAGVFCEDILRIAAANSRVPSHVAGDINAMVSALRTGVAGITRVYERLGERQFLAAVEEMMRHGETAIRRAISEIPDGMYVAEGEIDNDGVTPEAIPFRIKVEVDGSTIRIDYTDAPNTRTGPMNCPLPEIVSMSRIAVFMTIGAGQEPNEGHFRPIEVVTRPGSIFHALSPAPCFLYAWPAFQAGDVVVRALAEAMPGKVPAGGGGDVCVLVWWGYRSTSGEAWANGEGYSIGHGANGELDGIGGVMHPLGASGVPTTPIESWEAKFPLLVRRMEFAVDSGGAGSFQGGPGCDLEFEALEDAWLTSPIERTRNPGWGLDGGESGRANALAIRTPGGSLETLGKVSRLHVPHGAIVQLRTGGGGGYGPPGLRDQASVRRDLASGLISDSYARKHYPHVYKANGGSGTDGSDT